MNFPPLKIENPPIKIEGLRAGYCVFCGGSLGAPYQEDLFHAECMENHMTPEELVEYKLNKQKLLQ